MAVKAANSRSFLIRDCALAAIATGIQVQNLRELRDRLRTIPEGILFYHFWGSKLRPRFDNPEYRNDFAEWAHHGLHDQPLAERLAMIAPSTLENLENLRKEMLEVVEDRLDESEGVPWSKRDRQFHFIRSQIVVFDSQKKLDRPAQLPDLLPGLSVGSIFYHFIDARRHLPTSVDDFRAWLAGFGDEFVGLQDRLACINPYFLSLVDLRREMTRACAEYFGREEL